jgi:hypothetical protein
MSAPVGDEAPRHNPEETVMPAHVGTSAGAQCDGELLPQQHVLYHEGVPAPEDDEPSADEE